MKNFLIFLMVAGILAACGKDKFKTVPQVTIDSFGPEEVRVGNLFQLRASVTDKEGDLQDSVIVIRKRYAGTTLLTTDSSTRVSLKALGSPVKDKIELQLTFVYGRLNDGAITQDLEYDFDRNLTITVAVIDNAGNRGESAESKPVTLKKF